MASTLERTRHASDCDWPVTNFMMGMGSRPSKRREQERREKETERGFREAKMGLGYNAAVEWSLPPTPNLCPNF